jgi:hypothetical protein
MLVLKASLPASQLPLYCGGRGVKGSHTCGFVISGGQVDLVSFKDGIAKSTDQHWNSSVPVTSGRGTNHG